MHINTEFKLDPSGNRIYEFNCTFEQIRNYFFQFGKEATLIEPAELKEEFYNKYNEAIFLFTPKKKTVLREKYMLERKNPMLIKTDMPNLLIV